MYARARARARVCATTRAAAEWLSPGPAARGEDRCHAIEGKGMARVPVEILGNASRRPRAVLRDETSNHSALCWLLHRECLLCASVCCVRSVWRAFECVAFRTCSTAPTTRTDSRRELQAVRQARQGAHPTPSPRRDPDFPQRYHPSDCGPCAGLSTHPAPPSARASAPLRSGLLRCAE